MVNLAVLVHYVGRSDCALASRRHEAFQRCDGQPHVLQMLEIACGSFRGHASLRGQLIHHLAQRLDVALMKSYKKGPLGCGDLSVCPIHIMDVLYQDGMLDAQLMKYVEADSAATMGLRNLSVANDKAHDGIGVAAFIYATPRGIAFLGCPHVTYVYY